MRIGRFTYMYGVRAGSMIAVALLLTSILPIASSQAALDAPDGLPAAVGTRDEVVLRVAMQDDVKSLNPLVAGDVWTWNVLGYIYDTPLSVDLIDSSKYVPYIAVHSLNYTAESLFNFDNKSDWEPLAKDGQITVYYDFTDVKFHDGHQMDIDDILFSIGVQAISPDWTSSVHPLKDIDGNYSDTHWLAINKLSPTSLRFYLQTPFADFIRNTLSVFILPQHIWANKIGGQAVDNANPFLPKGNPNLWDGARALTFNNLAVIGSGPFKFDSWTPGQTAKITTWREHFNHPQPYIDAIQFKIYKTAEQAVQALQRGDIDYIAWSIPPTYVPELINDENIGISQSAEKGFFYMAYNMRKKSFGYLDNDPSAVDPTTGLKDPGKQFRLAVAHCVDKREIVERLLQNFGLSADGPVSAIETDWYNNSLPQYGFNPEMAKRMLKYGPDGIDNTSDDYKLTDPTKPAGKGNWWRNPDGTPIGSGENGKIEILTPPSDYDIRPQPGIMIATQMQNIGLNAESIALDFGTIVTRIEQRNFDMFILGWRIGSDPTDFMHVFFHSDNAESGQNYPGYQNASFDALIDLARNTSDSGIQHKAIRDAQAAIAYDQPYNVLYFRTNIEAYRADRFVNWTVGSSGSIFSWRSIMGIRPPSPYKLRASVSVESTVGSESESEIIVTVKNQDDLPVSGAQFQITCKNGTFAANGEKYFNASTLANGQAKIIWKAPYVPANAREDMLVAISIGTITAYVIDGVPYDPPAPLAAQIIKVKPAGSTFMTLRVELATSVIEAGSTTEISVKVTDQNRNPVAGATIETQLSEAGPTVTTGVTTDAEGMAILTFTAPTTMPEEKDFVVDIIVSHSRFTEWVSSSVPIIVIGERYPPPPPPHQPKYLEMFAGAACLAYVAVLAVLLLGRRRA
jgi:ABC-type transport system substrate-binding protein